MLAFVLTCYEFTPQLVRLVERLQPLASCVAVHCDRRAGRATERAVREGLAKLPNIVYLESRPCRWGDAGLVDAQIRGVMAVLESGIAFDHVCALTSSDYPIKSMEHMLAFFKARAGTSFMTYTPIPDSSLAFLGDQGRDRIQYWYARKPGRARWSPTDVLAWPKPDCLTREPVRTLWNTAVRCWPGGKRRFFEELTPHYGGCFWTLSREAAVYLADFCRQRPDVMRGMWSLLLPDEVIVQSILMSSPLASKIENNDYRYVVWERRDTGGPPAFLDERDLDALQSTPCLFARKFDERRSPGVLDQIERECIGLSGSCRSLTL
jgi:hypothetical protein